LDEVINGECSDTDQTTVHIDHIVDATITAIGPFCEDQDIEVSLIAIDGGGTWAGPGVVGNTFNPSIATAGDYIITYEVINGECSDTDQITVHVDQIVDATITAIGPFCEDQDIAVPLVAVDEGGTKVGPGVVGDTFNPSLAGAGDHIIFYEVSNGECSDTDQIVVHVDHIVDATITAIGPYCENLDINVSLVAVDGGGIWAGHGVVGDTFNPTLAAAGYHIITYEVINGECSDTDQIPVHVDYIVDATITEIGPFCETDQQVVLQAVDYGGNWSGIGIVNPVAGAFNPGLAGAGVHTITYLIINGECIDSDQVNILVDESPIAEIMPIGPFCDTDDNIILDALHAGGTWSGNGVHENVFSPETAGIGVHSVVYQMSNGICSDSDSITIEVYEMPQFTITPIGPFCETLDFAYLQASVNGGLWSGEGVSNPNTGQFSPLLAGAGEYEVFYTVQNDVCINSSSITIEVDSVINPTINPIGAMCQDGEMVNLTAVNPGGIWSGQGIIDPVNGILDPSQVEQGNNTMTYTITNGACESTDIHIYQVDELPDATITHPGEFCLDDSPIVLVAAQSGGIWEGQGISNPLTGAFNPTTAGVGTHTIIYSLSNSICFNADTIEINVHPAPDATITQVGAFCENDPAVELHAVQDGGVWSGQGVTENSFNPLLAGVGQHTITYEISVGNCNSSDNIIVTVYEMPDATITPIGPFCSNDSPVVLSAATLGGNWSGTGVVGNSFNPSIAGHGDHIISYNVVNGVCSDSNQITVAVGEVYSPILSGVNQLCENDNPIILTASIPGGVWSGQGIEDAVAGIFNPHLSGVGEFNIIYSLSSEECISESGLVINVHPNPNPIISLSANDYCSNGEFIVVVTSPPGGVLSGPGVSGMTFSPVIAGVGTHVIEYQVENAYTCSSTAYDTLTVHSIADISVSLDVMEFCIYDESEDIEGQPLGGDFSGNGVLGTKFFPSIAGSGMHEIFYHYTDEYGCTNLASVWVEVAEPLSVSLASQNISCNGYNDGSVQSEVTGGVFPYNYLWNDPNNSTSPDLNNMGHGNYTLTVTDSWGCTETASATLIQPTELEVQINSYTNVSCFGYNDGFISTAVSGGQVPYSYIWDDAEESETYYLNEIPAGIYSVTITDNIGCSVTASVEITEPDGMIIGDITSTDASCSGYSDGSMEITVNGGVEPYNYIWDNEQQSTTNQIVNVEAGTYSVTVTDDNGCSISESFQIGESASLIVSITNNNVICTQQAGSAMVGVAGGTEPYSYLWENGHTGFSRPNLAAGGYTVTVTDSNNCSKIAQFDILIEGGISAIITQYAEIECYGSSGAILGGSSSNGIMPLSYYWSDNQISQQISNLYAGSYHLTITDAWGCEGTASHFVEQPTPITLNADISSAGCFGADYGSISLDVSGGQPPYSYLWSNGTTESSINELYAGDYSVTVTDSNNCSTENVFNLSSSYEPISLNIDKKDISCYGYNDGSILLNPVGGIPPYTYLWELSGHTFNGQNLTGLYAGTYNVTVSDAQGCVIESAVTIGQPSQMEYSYYVLEPSCNINNDGYIEFEVIGGTPPYTYSFNDIVSDMPFIAGLISGQYSFVIMDFNGCKLSTDLIFVPENDQECITIPNAFTPNGDGINDEWIIENIELFPHALIQVFNRWGQLVWEGRGNEQAWDGTWNGNIVPTGSYIYTVNLFNNSQYCGVVTVVK